MSSWKWADGRKYISSPNGWIEIPYPPPAEDDEAVEEWVIKPCAIDWFGMGAGATGVAIPDPVAVAADCGVAGQSVFDTPPRHSADDYKGIAERLKQLGYRGWITG